MANLLIGHIEIPSTDLDRSKIFYNAVFGWEFKPFGNGYLLFNDHNGILVGLRKVEDIQKGNTTRFHVNVQNIEDSLKSTESSGGNVVQGKTIIPAMGWYALLSDQDGNVIGLFQRT